eukprot:superscaffoldBa00000934_g8077
MKSMQFAVAILILVICISSGYFIMGDAGYPFTEIPVAIITPHREPLQGRVKCRFNHYHAEACSIIELAFGLLKTYWSSLFFRALEAAHSVSA